MDTFWTIIGWLAVVLTASQFLPQVVKSIRTMKLRDISTETFIIIAIVTILWILYGIHNNAIEIVVANTVVHLSCDVILILKWITRKQKD